MNFNSIYHLKGLNPSIYSMQKNSYILSINLKYKAAPFLYFSGFFFDGVEGVMCREKKNTKNKRAGLSDPTRELESNICTYKVGASRVLFKDKDLVMVRTSYRWLTGSLYYVLMFYSTAPHSHWSRGKGKGFLDICRWRREVLKWIVIAESMVPVSPWPSILIMPPACLFVFGSAY